MRKQQLMRWVAFGLTMIFVMSLCFTAFAKYNTIPFGQKSDAVREMQSALRRRGFYKGSVDGNFGAETRKAVIRFQSSLGIRADGKPGDKTLTALYEGGSSAINIIYGRKATAVQVTDPSSLYYGCTGNRVRTLQKALKAAGYFKGAIDGKYGDLTELAVRKFQMAKGMHVDGIAGRKTLSRLNNAQKSVKLGNSFLLTIGSKGEVVKTVQRKLGAMGYKASPAAGGDIYGVFGGGTADIVRQWQKATGRAATGSMSEREYNALVLTK